MIKRNPVYNRPVTPHLVVYSPQLSSLLSIWHRITGFVLMSLFVSTMLFLKIFSSWTFACGISIFFFHSLFLSWLKKLLILTTCIMFAYHSMNGFRHILWDLEFFLSVRSLNISSLLLLVSMFIISLIITNITIKYVH